ncbi:hypothetical protein FA13DRAFT_1776809 [Coprinellus micaceus]|uniref:Uncharacterized protein n=1 Tax=Coprinellus micaceus TaxID=71717 RepID=A0A4Y7SY39_COPMI|nr:hypothetical protein FA13DRAFT_1776809 [Coprinellus micaceus]
MESLLDPDPDSSKPPPDYLRPPGPSGSGLQQGRNTDLKRAAPDEEDQGSRKKQCVGAQAEVAEGSNAKGKAKAKDENKETMEFSSVKALQMERLGVEGKYLGEFGEAARKMLADLLVKRQREPGAPAACKEMEESMIKRSWEAVGDRLVDDYQQYLRSSNQDTEDFARSLLFLYLKEICKLPNRRMQLHPEHWLSLSKTSKASAKLIETMPDLSDRDLLYNPMKLRNGSYELTVTGRIDWAVYVLPAKKMDMFDSGLTGGNFLDRVVVNLAIPKNDAIRMLLIEAKRTTSAIHNDIPQVLAQVHVSLLKTGREYMPWCLSSGREWYFGVCRLTGSLKKASSPPLSHVYFSTSSLWLRKGRQSALQRQSESKANAITRKASGTKEGIPLNCQRGGRNGEAAAPKAGRSCATDSHTQGLSASGTHTEKNLLKRRMELVWNFLIIWAFADPKALYQLAQSIEGARTSPAT